jgi:hypothetical protein
LRPATFETFVPGADDARARDGADDRRVDAEVRERLDEQPGRSLAHVGRIAACGRARTQRGPVGQAILAATGRRVECEKRVLPRRRLLGLRREQRRRLGRERSRRDDVGERRDPVHRRGLARRRKRRLARDLLRGRVGVAPVRPFEALERAARNRARPADDRARPPQERAHGGAGDQ